MIDAGIPVSSLQIVGIDAMPAAIAQAEAGIYASASLAGKLLPRPWWLLEADAQLCVHPRLRPVARFHCANLLDPGVLMGFGQFDLILSRNFLIYLTVEARQRWCDALATALTPGGRLYVAASEPVGQGTAAFAAIAGDVQGAFAHASASLPVASPLEHSALASVRPTLDAGRDPERSPASASPVPVRVSTASRASAEAPPSRAAGSLKQSVRADSSRDRRDRSMDALDPAVRSPVAVRPLAVADPRDLADAGQLDLAEALLSVRLDCAVPAAEDLVTSALLALARGRRDAAEDALRRALFLDHRHREAAALLASLLDQRGDVEHAVRLRARAGAAS